MSSCILCATLGGRLLNCKSETDRKSHMQLHFSQSRLIDGRKSLAKKDRHISKSGTTIVKGINLMKSSLGKFASAVFAKRSKSELASCQQCSEQLCILTRKRSLRTDRIIEHASKHLGKSVFNCLHCEYKAYTKKSIFVHMARVHKLKGTVGKDYQDLSLEYELEIKESIKSCFQEGAPKQQFDKGIPRLLHTENLINGQTFGSPLKRQRHIHANRLAVKAVDQNGKVRCRLCCGNIRQSVFAILDHAHLHMPNPMFQCKQCSKLYQRRHTMRCHVIGSHKMSSAAGIYEDRSDQFHSEIINMLDKCFGEE